MSGSQACRISTAPGRLNLAGVIDFTTTPELEPLLLNAIKKEQSSVILDMAGVTKINSAALALLIEVQRQAQTQGIAVLFMNLPSAILRLATSYNVLSFLSQETNDYLDADEKMISWITTNNA